MSKSSPVVNKIVIDCFGHIVPDRVVNEKIVKDSSLDSIPEYGLELDKETGSTHIVKKGSVDVAKLIDSYRESCGMALAQKMLSRGVDPSVFFDDGKSGGDGTAPTDLNTAFEQARAAALSGKRLADSLGLDFKALQGLSGEDLNNYVVNSLKAQIDAARSVPEVDK